MSEKEVPPDVRRLVIAAREDQGREALKELDEASEAFADRIPWDDEPAADKESEVMPSAVHKGRSYKHSARHATSPGVIAGASTNELERALNVIARLPPGPSILAHAPSPDEVERVARAIFAHRIAFLKASKAFFEGDDEKNSFSDDELGEARAAIAAMNRAPQPSREEDITNTKMLSVLENAFVEGGLWAEQYLAWNEGCSSRDLKEALQKHQDMMLTMNPASQPSREEMLVVLKETVELEHERLTNSPVFARRSVASIITILDRARAIIAQASKKAVEDV